MSVCSRYLECLQEVDWLTLLKLVIVKDQNGNHYLNLCYADCEDCDTLDFAIDCSSDITVEQLFRDLIGEDECGLPAINLTGNICAACE